MSLISAQLYSSKDDFYNKVNRHDVFLGYKPTLATLLSTVFHNRTNILVVRDNTAIPMSDYGNPLSCGVYQFHMSGGDILICEVI